MHRSYWTIALAVLLAAGSLEAQKKPAAKSAAPNPAPPPHARLTAVARSDRDSIVVRWAPSTALGWLAGNRLGYIVERVTMLQDPRAARATFHRLLPSPIKPWSLEEWKTRIAKDDRYEAIAVQALYGNSFVPRSVQGPTEALKDAADELTNRFGFSLFAADIDPRAATGLGLRIVDRDIKPGETYSYRIHLAGKDSLVQLDTAFAVASASPFVRPQAPPELTSEPGEHAVTLRWKSPADPRGGFTAFNIFRSSDGGKRFVKLNDLPFLTATGEGRAIDGGQVFTDTSAVDYVRSRYRVEGITPFADLSDPAEVDGMAVDLTPPPPPRIKKPVRMGSQSVRIDWEVPVTVPDLAGFIVSRSSFALKEYHLLFRRGAQMPSPGKGASDETRELMKLILPANTRSFVDSTATPREPYYVVGAIDTAGNLAQSLPAYSETIDTTTPAMPRGLTGTVSKDGIVHLHWHLGPERNIIGYRVLWANEPTHEFSQRINEPVPDTAFVDSVNIRTLSHFVYYRIAAISDRYIQSPLSPVFALRRPDVIVPASPVFLDVHVTESAVQLHWAASPSDDVARQILSRRIQGTKDWRPWQTFPRTQTRFLDTAVTQNVMYEYQIEAVDSTGLHSAPSLAVQARPFDPGIRAPVTDLSIRYDSTANVVRLTWKYASSRKERYWFVIYRTEYQGMVTEYASCESTVREFQDRRVQRSVSYRYAVRVKADGGAESPLSNPVDIRIGGTTVKAGQKR